MKKVNLKHWLKPLQPVNHLLFKTKPGHSQYSAVFIIIMFVRDTFSNVF